ncbi:MAG TPA: secretin N-terminal domain-containing protein [Gallionella sp.]|nr:secretin N-terminal domain-containing protein [Gallionella sp.]
MKKLLICLALLLLAAPVWAELEVIELQHRSAEDLLPIVRPLLDKEEVASAMNNRLILRASPKRIAEIKKLVESLDFAPRRLRITVMQDVDADTIARLTEVSGSVGVGRARVTVPGSGGTGGLSVEAGRGQDRLGARVYSTRSFETDRKTQQMQVLEGNRALVSSGLSVPVPVRQVIQHPWGTEVVDSTEYKQVDSGFYVLPRVSGDRVTVEISTQNDALAPNSGIYPTTRTQQTSSTVSGRLGEWMVVGGIGRGADNDSNTISTRSTARSQEQRNVLIKVEEME